MDANDRMLEALIASLFEFAVNMFQGILDYLSENLRPEKKMVIFLILLPITLLLIVFFSLVLLLLKSTSLFFVVCVILVSLIKSRSV